MAFFSPLKQWNANKALAAIILCSVILNVWSIWWGIPSSIGWSTDELIPKLVLAGIDKGFSGGWVSQYPPLHWYLLALAYSPFLLLEKFCVLHLSSTLGFFVVGRVVTLAMAAGLLYIIYRIGLELYRPLTALFPPLILCFSPVYVYYAKFANLDIPQLFWFSLSLLFLLKLVKEHQLKHYLLFSTAVALCVCTKDQAYAFYLFIPLVVAYSFHKHRRRKNPKASLIRSIFDKRNILSLILAAAICLLIHNLMFNLEGFREHISLLLGEGSKPYRIFDNTLAGHAEMLWQTVKQLDFILGLPLTLLCAAGFFYSCFQKPKNIFLLLLLVPAVSYYLFFISVVGFNHDRHLLPICLVISFFGANLIEYSLENSKCFFQITSVVLAAILMFSAARAASLNIVMMNDSRYYVEQWMDEHFTPEDIIGLIGQRRYLPRHGKIKRRGSVRPVFKTFKRLRIKPDYIIVNWDDARRWKTGSEAHEFIVSLELGKLGFSKVLHYKEEFSWLPFNPARTYLNGKRVITSNLDKINPDIRIYSHRK